MADADDPFQQVGRLPIFDETDDEPVILLQWDYLAQALITQC